MVTIFPFPFSLAVDFLQNSTQSTRILHLPAQMAYTF